MERLEPLSGKVIAAIKARPSAWRLVEKRAEVFITPKRAEKLAVLIPGDTSGKTMSAMASPAIMFLYLRKRLLAFFANPGGNNLDWTEHIASHPALNADFGDMVGRRRQCLAAARLAQGIFRIEARLATSVPAFSHADDLLNWYVSSGHHRLELDATRALHDLIGCEDEEVSNSGKSYFQGIDGEAAPEPGSMGLRVRQRLDALDARLAKFVEADPSKLVNDAKSIVGFLKGELAGELTPILSGDSDRRVWVLIFDGMRYDTWEDVVQPLFGEHFRVSGGPRFCVLPSYTLYARTSLLAGSTAKTWAANKSGDFTRRSGLICNEYRPRRPRSERQTSIRHGCRYYESEVGAWIHGQGSQTGKCFDLPNLR